MIVRHDPADDFDANPIMPFYVLYSYFGVSKSQFIVNLFYLCLCMANFVKKSNEKNINLHNYAYDAVHHGR